MSDRQEIKISKFKSEALRNLALKHNLNKSGFLKSEKLDKAELMLFVQDEEYKKLESEVANESDDVKRILGYTTNVTATEAVKPEAQAAKLQAAGPADATAKPDAQPAEKKTPYAEVSDKYAQYRESGKGPYDAYKAVENDFSGKEYKMALAKLKTQARDIDAQLNAIAAIGESDATSSKQVKRDAKATLAEQNGGKIDKWDRRAINGNWNVAQWISGQDSAMKDLRQAQAWNNNAEKVAETPIKMEEIVDKLGKKCPYLQLVDDGHGKQVTILEKAGLIKDNGDGTYDISELSEFVNKFGTGSEADLSRQQNRSVSERGNMRGELAAYIQEKTGIDLSDTKVKNKYIKRLVKLTGRHVEKKNIIKNAWENTLGGALAGLAGAGGALALKGKLIIDNSLYITDKVFIEQVVDVNGVEIRNLVDELKKIEDIDIQEYRATNDLAKDLTTAGVIAAAVGLLGSALSYGKSEQEVIPHITDCRSLKSFVTKIDTMVTNKDIKPVYGEIAKQIAFSFADKDGNLDCQAMNEFLGYEGGNGSRLNRTELMKALQNRLEEIKKKVTTPKPEVKPDKVEPEVKKPEVKPQCGAGSVENFKMDDSDKYGWKEIVLMYYGDCIENKDNPYADPNYSRIVHALKKFNNIRGGLKYVPAGIVLPYDLYGDQTCLRTNKTDVTVGTYKKAEVTAESVQLPNGSFRAYISCPNRNGSYTRQFLPGTYNTKAEADAAAAAVAVTNNMLDK